MVLADGRLANGDNDGNIKIWPKQSTGEPVVLSQGSQVLSLVLLRDGRLASAGADGNIKIWPKQGTGEPVVLSHGSRLFTLAVLKDGRLASAGEDGKIKLWLVDEQKLIAALCLRAGRNLTKDEWARYTSTPTLRGSRAVAPSASPQTGAPQPRKAAQSFQYGVIELER